MATAAEALSVRKQVQRFLDAACAGNLDKFKVLLKNLDEGKGLAATAAAVKDANDRTALHFAAREGRTEVCEYLLGELGLDPDPRDDDGETPLIHAARQGHVDAAKYLIEKGANISASSKLGATALHYAAGSGNLDLMNILLLKAADVEAESDAGTPLIWAAGHGQHSAVKFLLEKNANVNSETDDGITPLLSAVAAGSVECVELLIQAGARPNIIAGGATPLHIAAHNGSIEIIQCLLKAGADANACDEEGVKPIDNAAERGFRDAVEVLLPLTSPDKNVSNWSADELIKHYSEANRDQDCMKKTKLPKDVDHGSSGALEVSPEAKQKSSEAKTRGDDAFRTKDYHTALDNYTQALEFNPSDATVLSNRSLCWMRLGQADRALDDAKACRALKPDWSKACYREGSALRLLQRFDEAANAFYEGVKLDPENKELVAAFREAVDAGKKFYGADQPKTQ